MPADEAFKAKWAQLIAVRDEVKKVLEQARAEKTIGASLEAAVTLYCNDAVYDLLNSIPMDELADLMIVSQVELVKGEGGAANRRRGPGRCRLSRCGREVRALLEVFRLHRQPRRSPHPVRPLRRRGGSIIFQTRNKLVFFEGGAPGSKGSAVF